jgi:MFS family permease
MRAAFGTTGFKRLYAGLAASMLGDSLMLIVLSMWVKKLTDSNGAAGLTFLWLTIPALLAPLFGYVVDRVPRRAFLVAVNLGSAVAMMPLLLVRDASDVWIIYTVAFFYGVSFVVVPAALNGLLKDMLAEEVLVEANASLSVTREALRLVGPITPVARRSRWSTRRASSSRRSRSRASGWWRSTRSTSRCTGAPRSWPG